MVHIKKRNIIENNQVLVAAPPPRTKIPLPASLPDFIPGINEALYNISVSPLKQERGYLFHRNFNHTHLLAYG
jgi:hypothetical protein